MSDLWQSLINNFIVPVVIALITLFFGTKFNESRSNKIDQDEELKQQARFYLKLDNLIQSLEKHNSHLDTIKSIKTHHRDIKSGKEKFISEDYGGVSKAQFLNHLYDEKEEILDSKIPAIFEKIIVDFDILVACPIDKINPKTTFMCMEVLEIGSVPKNLYDNIDKLNALKNFLEPKFK